MDLQTSRQAAPVEPAQLVSLLHGWAGIAHGGLAQRLAHAVRRAVQFGVLAE